MTKQFILTMYKISSISFIRTENYVKMQFQSHIKIQIFINYKMKWDQKIQDYLTKLKQQPSGKAPESKNYLNTPRNKNKLKSIGKSQKQIKKQKIILPSLPRNDGIDNSGNSYNLRQNKSQVVRSSFAKSMQQKMNKVLQGINYKFDDENESYDSDDFDFQFKVKKNMEILKKNQQNKEKQKNKQNKIFLKPNINGNGNKVKEERPKSSRDISNDNNIIHKRNTFLFHKRPKSSRHSQGNSNTQVKKQIQSKQQQRGSSPKQMANQSIHFLDVKSQRENNSKNGDYNLKINKKLVKLDAIQPRKSKSTRNVDVNQQQQNKQSPQIQNSKQNRPIKSSHRISSQQKQKKNKIPTIKLLNRLKNPTQANVKQTKNRPPLPRGFSPALRIEQKNNQFNLNKQILSHRAVSSQGKQMTTQDLRDAKKQLQQKIKKIDEQLKNVQQSDLPLPNYKKQQFIKFNIGNKIGEDPSKTQKFNKQLEKLEQLQNKNDQVMGDFLEQRMLLIDMNINANVK